MTKQHAPWVFRQLRSKDKFKMHLEYAVELPDHQYVIASMHNLKPSVYAFSKIDPTLVGNPDAVKYPRPTAIRIRSCKHDFSTSTSHLRDTKRLLTGVDCGDDWKDMVINAGGETRPFLLLNPMGDQIEIPVGIEKNQASVVFRKKISHVRNSHTSVRKKKLGR